MFNLNPTAEEAEQLIKDDIRRTIQSYGYQLGTTDENHYDCKNPDEHYNDIVCSAMMSCMDPYNYWTFEDTH